MAILQDLSATAKLQAQIDALLAKQAALQARLAKAAQPREFSIKAQTSGAGRVYMVIDTGVGRPIALYKAQFDALFDNAETVLAFVSEHPELS